MGATEIWRRPPAAVVARPCPAPTTSPAWRPARYLVFRGAFAPLSTNTGQSLKIFGFVGRVGQISSNQLLLGRPSLTPAVQR